MNVLSRIIGSVVAAAAVAFGLAAATAPAASAATGVVPTSVTVAAARPGRWCTPAHTGRNWRWDDGRRGGHWDKREWNRRAHRWEWRHQWRDDRYCAPRRFDGPPRRFDGPPANPRGPERGRF